MFITQVRKRRGGSDGKRRGGSDGKRRGGSDGIK